MRDLTRIAVALVITGASIVGGAAGCASTNGIEGDGAGGESPGSPTSSGHGAGTSTSTHGATGQSSSHATGSTGHTGSATGTSSAGPSTSASTGSSGGVVCSAAGAFCGGHGADGGDPSTLYVCPGAGASPVSSSACSNGCTQNQGEPDACTVTQGNGGLTCAGQGLYCGGDQIGGDAGTLYDCPGSGLAPSSSQPCANGCQVNPPGTNDLCKAGLTCAGAGDYCGGDQIGGDTNTLYHCPGAGQSPSGSDGCSNGCVVNPSGTNDVCRAGLSCPGSGAYCGGDGVQGGDSNTLYQCPGAGQAPSSADACPSGCSIQPEGTADYCVSGGTCPTPGDYCGGDGVSGPSNVLYHCTSSGQAPASSTTCPAGCNVEPQGTADFCASTGTGSCTAAGQAALNWEANQLNQGNSWSDYCLAFVYDAFASTGDTIGFLQQPTAADSLAAAENTGHFVGWNGSCPCGAILYWPANACNGEDGHVVICDGDGTVSTSGWPGFAGGTSTSITWLDGEECGATPAGYILP